MLNLEQSARKWKLDEGKLAEMAASREIEGAMDVNGVWMFPDDVDSLIEVLSPEPDYSSRPGLMPNTGVDQYGSFMFGSGYYVDKTLVVKGLVDSLPGQPVLITRPRRFGKSLCLSMLHAFFENTGFDTSGLFRDKLIWKEGPRYRTHQGKYPVLHITFGAAVGMTWEKTLDRINFIFRTETRRHSELIDSPHVPEETREIIRKASTLKVNDLQDKPGGMKE